jgi:hypothetical protein
MVAWLMEQLLEWLAQRVLEVLEFVMGVLADTLFVVPNVAALPQVRGIWSQNLSIVNTAYLLAIIAAGVVAMTHETVQVRYSVKDLLPRVVLGAVAANFSLTWCGMLLELGDALTHAVAGQPLADTGSLEVIKTQLVAALTDPQVALLTLLVAGVATVLLFLLIFQWITRFGVLLVLAVVGPFALAAYCLPQLDAAAGLWWRTLLGTLGTHLLQALTLYTGLATFLAPDSQLPSLLPALTNSQLGNLLVLLVLLFTCVKIPALMRRYLLRSGGGSGARIVGVLVLQQLTRGLGLRGRGPARLAAGGRR